MCSLRAVATASVASAERSVPSLLASIPSTHFSARATDAVDSRWIDCSTLRAMSGTRTLSSNWPCMPPIVTAASLPMTWAATWRTTSGITGLTLPGMLDERVAVALRLERVLGRGDLEPRLPRQQPAHLLGEPRVRVQAGAGGGAAQ